MTLHIKDDLVIPIKGLLIEVVMAHFQTRTNLILYVYDGEIHYWPSLDEVPDGGYDIDCSPLPSSDYPAYWECRQKNRAEGWWVASFAAVVKMCSLK